MEDELYRDYFWEKSFIAAQIQAEQDEEHYQHLMSLKPEAKITVKIEKDDRVEIKSTEVA